MRSMFIKIEQVVQAIEESCEAYQLFLDTVTGEKVYLPDPVVTGETNEDLAMQIECNPGRYLPFPTKYDVHEYRIMESFIVSLPTSRAKQELSNSIRGKGAFQRYRDTLRYHRLEQQWYVFRDEAFKEYSVRWCRDNNIGYEI